MNENRPTAPSPDQSFGIRPGEIAADLPEAFDASLYFVGRIRTPWQRREECPRRGSMDGPLCRIEVDPRWRDALTGIEQYRRLLVLYWMHLSRRDLVLQSPKHRGSLMGTFALRSPVRPNPVAAAVVGLEKVEGTTLFVRGLDCVDGTALLDLKPDFAPAEKGCDEPT
ncbi:tRNA (N6-threonylcarbamoyladenosine(37)-N6)-methyltransferase TrmO [Stappia sp. F7233]|uniref:tRNA (N6-threonylcarbamoyladenosine(37)-N6)-methyltransferase TrmO n=1 Tax=Stappia albiluteola TaxID=2758565 RepID=A0A839AGW4_9HYPH|nr:tRNA (N6-threonylcarbamoyladenosine(37)-N6)-methyltransferase TrmO [Stappia albiluteola]MBA5778278.1 tRNA (N6-threonylcarbamoyladenosine(37)-N6)-methyltransferase TrmO [Stappia albiluteola]